MHYIIPREALEAFYDEPGEKGWILEGFKHGLTTISLILTEKAHGVVHTMQLHHTDEIYVLSVCLMEYIIRDK